jgi:hypothetical protein
MIMVSNTAMSCSHLDSVQRRVLPGVWRDGCMWAAKVGELELYVFVDEVEDRVRIMVPVAQADEADPVLMLVLLTANFELARDARYALRDGLVWCLFGHRLSWLSEPELHHAIRDVLALARNTGGTFSSDDLPVESEA